MLSSPAADDAGLTFSAVRACPPGASGRRRVAGRSIGAPKSAAEPEDLEGALDVLPRARGDSGALGLLVEVETSEELGSASRRRRRASLSASCSISWS